MLNASQVRERFDDVILPTYEGVKDIEGVLAVIVLKSPTAEPKRFELMRFVFQSGAWRNGVDPTRIGKMNKDIENSAISIPAGESVKVALMTDLLSSRLTAHSWSKIHERQFVLALVAYPDVTEFLLPRPL